MQLLHQILSLVTQPAEKVLEKQQGDEISQYSEYLSLIPSSKVPAGQIKQAPHFAAALCLGENPGSSASYSNSPPMSQICVVNPGPGIEGNKEPQPCFVPTISWLKHTILFTYTHTHTHKNPNCKTNPKQTNSYYFIIGHTNLIFCWCFF